MITIPINNGIDKFEEAVKAKYGSDSDYFAMIDYFRVITKNKQ